MVKWRTNPLNCFRTIPSPVHFAPGNFPVCVFAVHSFSVCRSVQKQKLLLPDLDQIVNKKRKVQAKYLFYNVIYHIFEYISCFILFFYIGYFSISFLKIIFCRSLLNLFTHTIQASSPEMLRMKHKPPTHKMFRNQRKKSYWLEVWKRLVKDIVLLC